MNKMIFFAFSIGLSIPVYAEVDLLHVYQLARPYDTRFSAAEAALRAGEEKAVQARSLWLPKVDVSADYGRSGTETIAPLIFQSSEDRINSVNYGVNVRQTIYDAGTVASFSQLRAQTELARVTYQQAEQDLILRVAKVYFDVLLAQDKLSMVRSQKQAVAQQLDQAQKSYAVGVSTLIDVQDVQARYDQIVAHEVAAVNEEAAAHNAFFQLTGRDAAGLAPLNEQHFPLLPAASSSDWLQRGEQHSLEIAAKRLTLAIKDAEVDKYGVLREPSVTVQAGYAGDRQHMNQPGLMRHHNWSVALKVSVPLFTGGEYSSKKREAAAEKNQAQDELESARRDTALNIKQALLEQTSGSAQVKALTQALSSANSALASTRLGLMAGTRTQLDVLNAEQKVYETRRDLAEARYGYLQSQLKLAAAAGLLTLQDLQQVNTALSS